MFPDGAASASDAAAVTGHVVSVVFAPPHGPRTLVALAPNCGRISEPLGVCNGLRGDSTKRRACCREVVVATDTVAGGKRRPRVDVAPTFRGLRFRFPDTDSEVGTRNDGRTLAGPSLIVVTALDEPLPTALLAPGARCGDIDGVVACVDQLADPGASGRAGRRGETFGHFTALPPRNDFGGLLCAEGEGPCLRRQMEMRLTVDGEGNVLVPMDWRGVLLRPNALPIARLVRGETAIRAFDGSDVAIAVDEKALGSFSPEGIRLPPLFTPQLDREDPATAPGLRLFGTSDATFGVLRIARRLCLDANSAATDRSCTSDADCGTGVCGPPAFDLSDRFEADGRGAAVGPVVLRRDRCALAARGDAATCTANASCESGRCGEFTAEALDGAPIEGITSTSGIDAFVVPELFARSSQSGACDLNGDCDGTDDVVVLADHRSGIRLPIGDGADGRAITQVRQGPFRRPALAVQGGVAAFLESESGQSAPSRQVDRNGDGDHVDSVLRAYRLDVDGLREVTDGARPLVADAAPALGGKAVVVSDGLVVFRTREADSASRSLSAVSLEKRDPETSECLSAALSGDGTVAAFGCGRYVYRYDGTPALEPLPVPQTPTLPRRISLPRCSGAGMVSCDVEDTCGAPAVHDVAISDAGDVVAWSYCADGRPGGAVYDVLNGARPILAAGGDVALVGDGTVAVSRLGHLLNTTQDHYCVVRTDLTTATQCAVTSASVADGALSMSTRGDVIAVAYGDRMDLFGALGHAIGAIQGLGAVSLTGDGLRMVFTAPWPLVSSDTNGQQDVFLSSLDRGTIQRVSVASDGTQGDRPSFGAAASRDERHVAFTSSATTLVPGDDPNVAPYLRDTVAGVTQRLGRSRDGLAVPMAGVGLTASSDGLTVAFLGRDAPEVDPGDANKTLDVFVDTVDNASPGADMTGNGRVSETVLRVLDTASGVTHDLCPATTAVVAARHIAFLRPESQGAAPGCPTPSVDGSLNADDDARDSVVHRWTPDAGVHNLGVAASAIAVGDRYVAAIVTEESDADADVGAVWIYSADLDRWVPTNHRAESVAMCGATAVFITPESIDGVDLNDDGDAEDRVVRMYDPPTSTLVDVRQAVEEIACSATLLAFRTSERAQGHRRLTDDDDVEDATMQLFDLGRRECRVSRPPAGCLVDTRQAAVPCREEACDASVPYRVLDRSIRFITDERDASADLNGDGDRDDRVVQAFSIVPGPVGRSVHAYAQVVGVLPRGHCPDGSACTSDAECFGGACFVAPGQCLRTGASCKSGDSCSGGVCQLRIGSQLGTCIVAEGTCSTNADCAAGAQCQPSTTSGRLLDPFSPIANPRDEAGGDAVFVSAGHCIEEVGTCDAGSCPDDSVCTSGVCGREHGPCDTNADCPPGATCEPRLTVSTISDRDGDEVPDHDDVCPDVYDPQQRPGACGACDPATASSGVCDDRNPCTDDVCGSGGECMHVAVADDSACADGDACNGAERCRGGRCAAGEALACPADANPCSVECDPDIGCASRSAPDGTMCDDGDASTSTDVCRDGVCVGTRCPPPGACRVPVIDAEGVCTSMPIADGTGCDDGDPCTGADTCRDGTCAAGGATSCDDGDPCSVDGCDPTVGCRHDAIPPSALDPLLRVDDVAACDVVPPSIARRVVSARRLIGRALRAPSMRLRSDLYRQARRRLASAERQVLACTAPRCRMTAACADALLERFRRSREIGACIQEGAR